MPAKINEESVENIDEILVKMSADHPGDIIAEDGKTYTVTTELEEPVSTPPKLTVIEGDKPEA